MPASMSPNVKAAVCSCLAALLFTSACGQQTGAGTQAADERAIRELDGQWSKAAAASDLDSTVSYYRDDATLLPPNAAVVVGKPAIRALWASMLVPGSSISWQPNQVMVSRSGDLAYLTGTYI